MGRFTMPGVHRSTLWWPHQLAKVRFGPPHPGPTRRRSRHRPACARTARAACETHRPHRGRMDAPSILSNQACCSTLTGPAACLKSAPESMRLRHHQPRTRTRSRPESPICGPLGHQIDRPSHAAHTNTKTASSSKSLLRTAPPAHCHAMIHRRPTRQSVLGARRVRAAALFCP